MKFKIPRHKIQTITHDPQTNSRQLNGQAFWNLKIGSLGFAGCLGFGIWCFVFMPSACLGAETAKVFQEANASYKTGDYAKAAGLYESLTLQEPQVAAFYYDLANAYVRLGKWSRAILNYEKALRLDPRNADVRENLRYARGLLEYRAEDTRNGYLKATEAVLKYMTDQEVLIAAFSILFVFLSGGILYFLNGRGVFWNPWQRFVFFLLLIATLAAVGKQIQSHVIRDAIVMQKECEARYGPSEHDQVAFRMGEGIKVFVMDRREDWNRVLLTNGESGWVKDSAIAEVKV